MHATSTKPSYSTSGFSSTATTSTTMQATTSTGSAATSTSLDGDPDRASDLEQFGDSFSRLPIKTNKHISSYLPKEDARTFSGLNWYLYRSVSYGSTLNVYGIGRFSLAQDFQNFQTFDHLLKLGGKKLPALYKPEESYSSKSDFFQGVAFNCRSLYIFLRKFPDRINERDENGQTILHHAATIGPRMGSNLSSLILELLFSTPGINFNIKDLDNNTPIHVAGLCSNDRVTCDFVFPNYVRRAAELGFDFTTQGSRGLTVLHIAALNTYHGGILGPRKNVSNILEILKEKNIPNLKAVLDTLTDSGSTALYYCINRFKLTEAADLLDAGADAQLWGAPDRSPTQAVSALKQEIQIEKEALGTETDSPFFDNARASRLNELNSSLLEFESRLKGGSGSKPKPE